MKLYPIAPNAESVARHFERMASGRVHTTRGQRAGYGFLGSRINLGSYSVMKGGAGTKENPQTVRGISPTEVGIQQAKSELQAQGRVLNTNKKDKKDKKKKKTTTVIKPKGAKGKGQSKPGERGSKTSAKKGSGAKGKGVKKATKGAGARAAGTCKKRKTKKEEADELKKKKLNKLKRLAAEKKAKAKAKAKTDNFA
jgi:hypothetical protein